VKWFDRWFAKKCKHAWESEHNRYSDVAVSVKGSNRVSASDGLRSDGIRMTMYHANGGYVLEFEKYDRLVDRMDRDLYVIQDDGDLGGHIARAVSMHLLRNT
jgi:hypothetical protein